MGGATSSVEEDGRGAADSSEEAPLLLPVVVILAFAMLQSALSKCWWRWPPLRLGPFFLWAGRRPP